MKGDAVYFSRRANEERAAAMKAPNANARQAHLEMADRYSQLASAVPAVETSPAASEITG